MEDALNQSTENDDKLEPEEDKAVAVTHLPSEDTQLRMATTEESDAAMRTIDEAEQLRTHVCVGRDLIV